MSADRDGAFADIAELDERARLLAITAHATDHISVAMRELSCIDEEADMVLLRYAADHEDDENYPAADRRRESRILRAYVRFLKELRGIR